MAKKSVEKGEVYSVRITIRGVTPYSPGKHLVAEKLPKETDDRYDVRVWRERITEVDGVVCLPIMAFKYALESAASRMRRKIPGLGTSEYGAYFLAGLIPLNHPSLGVKVEDVRCENLFLPVKGERAVKSKGKASKRVFRHMPVIDPPWETAIELEVIDGLLIPEIVEEAAIEAGKYIGLGRWRPQVGGINGRFIVTKFEVF